MFLSRPVFLTALALGLCGPGAFAQSSDIVGGQDAKPGRWPAQAAIVLKEDPKFPSSQYINLICGGTLISPRDVLTAAHCVDERNFAAKHQVLLHTQVLDTRGFDLGSMHTIASVSIHPQWTTDTRDGEDFDVAVIRLAEPVADIKPMKFITSTAQEAAIAGVGRLTTTLGWGDTRSRPGGASNYPSVLQQVAVPIYDRDACRALPKFDGVTDNMLCAGYIDGGKDSCTGDSGGPLIAKGKRSQKFDTLVGVVSWGIGCAAPNEMGVYARLATLGAWVKAQVAKP